MRDVTQTRDEIASRFLSVLPRLQHLLRKERQRREAGESVPHVLSERRGQYHLLGVLERHGRMPIQQLADRLDVSPPTVSTMVRSLEEAGLVQRERDPGDQRVVWVSLTDVGATTLRDELRRWRAVFLDRFERLDATDQQLIVDAIPALERLVETQGHTCMRKER